MIDDEKNLSFVEITQPKDPAFKSRHIWANCENTFPNHGIHDFEILFWKDKLAVGICKKCALLDGGWAIYD